MTASNSEPAAHKPDSARPSPLAASTRSPRLNLVRKRGAAGRTNHKSPPSADAPEVLARDITLLAALGLVAVGALLVMPLAYGG